MFKKLVVFSFVIALMGLTACSSSKKEIVSASKESDVVLYNKAVSMLEQKKYKQAKDLFVELSTNYPYSEHASACLYLEAYTEYKLKNYETAVVLAEEYISMYPDGDSIEEAYFLKAISYYDQIEIVTLSQVVTQNAYEAFQDLLSRFPNTQYKGDVEIKIDLIRDSLAGKEMEIGMFYLKKNNIIAAIDRYQEVVKKYPQTIYIEEALYRLVEANLIINLSEQAKIYAAILGANYPSSKWYIKSYNLMSSK